MKVGVRRKDALYRSTWSFDMNKIAAGLRSSGHPHLLGILPDFNDWCLSLSLCIRIYICKYNKAIGILLVFSDLCVPL